MKKIIGLLVLLASSTSRGQTQFQLKVDSVGALMAEYVDAHAADFDSASFVQHFAAYGDKILHAIDTADAKNSQLIRTLPALLVFRLLHHSSLVSRYISQTLPKNNYWTCSDEMPSSSISREDCASFWTHTKFIYHDSDSTVVHLSLDRNFWLDSMSDHTYSKLTVKKLNDQTFQSVFIDSNNPLKSLYSIPGDKYWYQLLEKKAHSYKLSTHMNGIDFYYIFELEY